MKNITAQEIKDQSKQLCDLWAILIDGTPPVRDIRNWLLDYELAAIESALRVCSRFVARQPEPEQVPAKRKVKYLKGVLHKAKYEAQTPEEREQEVSAIRAAAGSRGAYVKWQKEKLAACVCYRFAMICHRLLAFARVMVMVMVKVMRVTGMGQVQAKPWHHPPLHHFLPTASPTQNLGALPRTPQRGLLAPLSPSGD